MIRSVRLRFWLAMLDVAAASRKYATYPVTRSAQRKVYLWLVGRASNATDWGSL